MANTIPLIWSDLLEIEQGILTVMSIRKSPIGFWQLYTAACMQIYLRKNTKSTENQIVFTLPENFVQVSNNAITKDLLGDKKNWEYIAKLREWGAELPSNRRFKAILEGMEACGWVKHRSVAKKIYYTLTDYAKPIADKNTIRLEVPIDKDGKQIKKTAKSF